MMMADRDDVFVINPSEMSTTFKRRLFRMWFGAVGTMVLYVWAGSFEDAFEECIDYLDAEGKCGFFHGITEADYREAAAELGIDWPAGMRIEELGERDVSRIEAVAEADITLIGHTTLKCRPEDAWQVGIPSWEWGGDDVAKSSEEYAIARSVSGERQIIVTYEVVTPESAAEGDVDDRGIEDEITITADDLDEGETFAEHAAKMIRDSGGGFEPDCSGGNCVPRWYTAEPIQNRAFFERGEEKRLSFHVGKKEGWDDDERRVIARILLGTRGGFKGVAGLGGSLRERWRNLWRG